MPEVSWTPQVSHRRFAPGSLVFIFESDLALETAKAGLVTLADGMITFRWRDSAHHNKKRLITLGVDEFLRRLLLHVLPPGFVRIRSFGFLAHRRRGVLLPLCVR